MKWIPLQLPRSTYWRASSLRFRIYLVELNQNLRASGRLAGSVDDHEARLFFSATLAGPSDAARLLIINSIPFTFCLIHPFLKKILQPSGWGSLFFILKICLQPIIMQSLSLRNKLYMEQWSWLILKRREEGSGKKNGKHKGARTSHSVSYFSLKVQNGSPFLPWFVPMPFGKR